MGNRYGVQADPEGNRLAFLLYCLLVVGVLLAISAESLFQSKPLGDVGAGLALTSGLLYLFFRLLGRREEKRRRQEAERAGDDNHEDP